jgi:hypothetical protein
LPKLSSGVCPFIEKYKAVECHYTSQPEKLQWTWKGNRSVAIFLEALFIFAD